MTVTILNRVEMMETIVAALKNAAIYKKPFYVYQHPSDDTWQGSPIIMEGSTYIQIMPDGTSSLHCDTCEVPE